MYLSKNGVHLAHLFLNVPISNSCYSVSVFGDNLGAAEYTDFILVSHCPHDKICIHV